MRPNETRPLAYLMEFIYRSKWNVIGLILGYVVACIIWNIVEPVQAKVVLAVLSFVLIFFGFLAIGIKKEYAKEDQEKRQREAESSWRGPR